MSAPICGKSVVLFLFLAIVLKPTRFSCFSTKLEVRQVSI